jgi:multicomponent Na+:H+ antiporter subunit F
MIALAAMVGVLIALCGQLVRVFSGPTLYDRAFAAKTVLTHATLLAAGAATLTGARAGIEVAIALYLGAAVLSVAVLKFFRTRAFQPPLASRAEP